MVPEEVRSWGEKREEIAGALREAGLNEKAIELTMHRLSVLAEHAGKPLVGMFKASGVRTLKDEDMAFGQGWQEALAEEKRLKQELLAEPVTDRELANFFEGS